MHTRSGIWLLAITLFTAPAMAAAPHASPETPAHSMDHGSAHQEPADDHAGGHDHGAMDEVSTPFDQNEALRLSQQAVGRQVGNRKLVDANGKVFELREMFGKPLVISLIYTSCYHICPTTTKHLAEVVAKARKVFGADGFRVLSIGFDTRVDTPQAMGAFSRAQGIAGGDNWRFVSLSAEEMEGLGRDLGFVFYPSSRGFDHMIQASVLDGRGVVYRQVYGMTFETPLLLEPLRELTLGTPKHEDSLVADLVRRVRFFCTTYDPGSDAYRFDYSIFIGMAIGTMIIGGGFFFLWNEKRKKKLAV
ncbi:MAG: SCO family protein [Magnetococcales bacterium]|nr:SCO family protein [Magnetococcales bacterium]